MPGYEVTRMEVSIKGMPLSEWAKLDEAVLVDPSGNTHHFGGFLLISTKLVGDCLREAIPPGWILMIGRKL